MQEDKRLISQFRERSKTNRRRDILGLITLLLPIILIAVFLYGSRYITWFNIKEVQVVNLSSEDFKYIDGQKISSKLTDEFVGDNLFKLEPESINKELKEIDPFVATAIVEKQFPNTVSVKVLEREPYLYIRTASSCWVVDQEGYVLDGFEITEVEVVENEEGRGENNQVDDGQVRAETSNSRSGITQLLNRCEKINRKYEVISFSTNELKAEFTVGESSTFYRVEQIYIIDKVLHDYNYEVNEIKYDDGLYRLQVGSKEVILSSQQSIDEQLKRFVLVSSKIEQEGLEFRKLDLRYDRPVLSN